MVDANKSVDAFIKDHPTMAKMSGMFLDALGYVAVGVAAASGAGAFAGVVVGGAAFDFVTEKGAKEFVTLCASQGRTEAEALKYGEAAAGVVEKTLAIAAIRGGIKALGGKFKHKARILSKTEASALAKEAYLNKGGKGLVNDNPVSKALDGAKGTIKVSRDASIFGIVDNKAKVGDITVTSFVRDAPGSINTAIRQRTALAFQEAGILNDRYELTPKAITESKMVSLVTKENPDGSIRNDEIIKILTKDGSNINDWHKYTTKSIRMHAGGNKDVTAKSIHNANIDMSSGENRQIHFYMNEKTGKIDYETIDFKVKSTIALDPGLISKVNKK